MLILSCRKSHYSRCNRQSMYKSGNTSNHWPQCTKSSTIRLQICNIFLTQEHVKECPGRYKLKLDLDMNKLDDLVIYFKRFLEDENNYKKSEKLRSWSYIITVFFGTVILNSVTVLDSWIISADTTVYFVYFVLFILNTYYRLQ